MDEGPIGPVSTLPGYCHPLPKDAVCDNHHDRLAVSRVQGETDSFGCEVYDLCKECLDKHLSYTRSPKARTGKCDWCKNEATNLSFVRDSDEGSYGPVYHVCGSCRKKQDDRINEELSRYPDLY